MQAILIKNATIVNEGKTVKGNVLCDKGRIKKIFSEEIPGPAEEYSPTVIEAEGRILMPGLIDDQVHFREPGLTHKGDIYTESRAAVAGGITSYMEMPNTSPPATTRNLVDEKFRIASGSSFANYSFYIGATNDNLAELLDADTGKICGVKIFMGSSTGNMLVDSEKALRSVFSHIKIPVAVHCEDETIIRENIRSFTKKYGEDIPVSMHPAIRSAGACLRSSSRAVKLAREYGTRLHVLHVSTENELKLFDSLTPIERKSITAEVCIHHLWFDSDDYARLGNRIKWNPAIKTAKDKEALIEAVNSGRIDVIATDHAPHTEQEKSEKYLKAPSGGPMVQHALAAMMELAARGKISLEKIVEKMCHAPAIIYKINKRGFIREGYWADLVLVDPGSAWTVSRDNLLYKCRWSPMEGQVFGSRVTHTIVNGNLVFDNGSIEPQPKGIQLAFDR